MVTTKALNENGYHVINANSTTEAMEIFHREDGNFNLIFSDVVLPDNTGIELLEELLEINPDLNVLLCSGYTDHKSQFTAIRKKGFSFIQKPYALIDLLKVIKETIQETVPAA